MLNKYWLRDGGGLNKMGLRSVPYASPDAFTGLDVQPHRAYTIIDALRYKGEVFVRVVSPDKTDSSTGPFNLNDGSEWRNMSELDRAAMFQTVNHKGRANGTWFTSGAYALIWDQISTLITSPEASDALSIVVDAVDAWGGVQGVREAGEEKKDDE